MMAVRDNEIKSILVVDDQSNWRRDLSNLLRQDGYGVTTVSTFEGGLQELKQHIFDLVILDVRLEDKRVDDVEGLELLLRVQSLEPSPKVIVLTGYPESIEDVFWQEHKVDALVFKVPPQTLSFDVKGFKETVHSLLHD